MFWRGSLEGPTAIAISGSALKAPEMPPLAPESRLRLSYFFHVLTSNHILHDFDKF
jgi:hypothetical protein